MLNSSHAHYPLNLRGEGVTLPSYLMPHEVLLERIAILEDFETVRTEQVPCVFVDHSEMAIHFRIERGTILTDLQEGTELTVT